MPQDQWRRVRGEQEIIVRYAPDEALATLPQLLRNAADRERLVALVQRLLADERVQRAKPSTEQLAMVESIGQTLSVVTDAASPARSPRKRAHKVSRKTARKAAAGARA